MQYGKFIFRHVRNLFDMDPPRSGRGAFAASMGNTPCRQGKNMYKYHWAH